MSDVGCDQSNDRSNKAASKQFGGIPCNMGFPAIWDSNSKEYCNREIKMKVWQSLSEVTNLPEKDLKRSYDTIRRRFRDIDGRTHKNSNDSSSMAIKSSDGMENSKTCPLEVSIQVIPCDLVAQADKCTSTSLNSSRKRRGKTTSPKMEKKPRKQCNGVEDDCNTTHEARHSNQLTNTESSSHKQLPVHLDPFIPDKNDPLFNRQVVTVPHSVVDGTTFSVVTYNILAEYVRKTQDYSYTEEKYLDMSYRHPRIVDEIRYLDADIVCMQEVECSYYSDKLKPQMSRLGYDGHLCVQQPENLQGEATFYKSSQFLLKDLTELSYRELASRDIDCLEQTEEVKNALKSHVDQGAVLLIAVLQHVESKKQITIGNTHLTWTHFKDFDISSMQMAYAFKQMALQSSNNDIPFVLCGDFNTRVVDPGYQLALEGYLNDSSLNVLQGLNTVKLPDGASNSLVNLLWSAFQHPARSVNSSYLRVQGREPKCSSRTNRMDANVDYLFSYKLNTTSVTAVNEFEGKLPNQTYPSDHLSLGARYNL